MTGFLQDIQSIFPRIAPMNADGLRRFIRVIRGRFKPYSELPLHAAEGAGAERRISVHGFVVPIEDVFDPGLHR